MAGDWRVIASAMIAHFEGCKLSAYPDPASGGEPWTVGYGATGAGIEKGATWTQAQADADLRKRVRALGTQIRGCAKVRLSAYQLAALIDLAYNIGFGALRSSTLMAKLNARDYAGAAAQFPEWSKSGRKTMLGLQLRRAGEQAVFLWGGL